MNRTATMKYNIGKIKAMHSYTPQEIAVTLGINKKTVFRWIENGLAIMEKDTKPLLLMGSDIKSFLRGERVKITLEPNECYCLKCRKATQFKPGSETVEKTGYLIGKAQVEQRKKIGLCSVCGSHIQKFLGVNQNN